MRVKSRKRKKSHVVEEPRLACAVYFISTYVNFYTRVELHVDVCEEECPTTLSHRLGLH